MIFVNLRNRFFWCFVVLTIALVGVVPRCRAEIFTAMADVEMVLSSEKGVVGVIDNYIEAEMKRLKALRDFSEEYQEKNSEAMQDGDKFVANPVNAYLLVKRLTADWNYVEKLMTQNSAQHFLQNITAQREVHSKFPGTEDLNGAAVALMRLQDTYKLDTADIAEGRIQGVKRAQELNAHDCFELGRVAYNEQDYYHTLLWMQEALNRVEHEEPPTTDAADIYEYLAYSMYMQGNVKRAMQLTRKLMELVPNHERAAGNLQHYEEIFTKQEKQRGDEGLEIPPLNNDRPKDRFLLERDVYEALCRGEMQEDFSIDPKITCYYKADQPFLWLAPLKAEVMRLRPKIILFHKVINDEEIAKIKEMAHPRLQRATVQDSKTGELVTATYRISKSAWLKPEEDPIIERVIKRGGMMSNLNMKTSEDLQVANYGIGGHYDPHFDFARKEEKNAFKGLGTGNRIATVLFYISQPDAGGATVFPELRTALFPSKYDAAFWFNLKTSGEGDMTTRHAGCPVLAGIKWVSNLWIHERGQEFTRPCDLDENDYE